MKNFKMLMSVLFICTMLFGQNFLQSRNVYAHETVVLNDMINAEAIDIESELVDIELEDTEENKDEIVSS